VLALLVILYVFIIYIADTRTKSPGLLLEIFTTATMHVYVYIYIYIYIYLCVCVCVSRNVVGLCGVGFCFANIKRTRMNRALLAVPCNSWREYGERACCQYIINCSAIVTALWGNNKHRREPVDTAV